MSFPNVSDIIATTIERRSGKISNNVENNNAILFRLNQKGKVKPFGGGRLIYEELSFTTNPNGGWYSGYDTLSTSPADVISAAEFALKQLACPVVVSGQEMLENSGEEAVISLIASRVDVAEATLKNLMSTGLYSDGTGSGGKQIVGLDAAVPQTPTTGTYGGINRATASNAFWRSQVLDPASTPTASTIQGFMNTLYASCSRGTDQPDLILAGGTVWATFMGSLQAIQRVSDAKMAEAGFNSVKYMGADVVLDGGIGGAATATDMYFLNTNYIRLRPHKDRNFVPLSPEKRWAYNQDAAVQILAWAGALTCSGAMFQGRGKFD